MRSSSSSRSRFSTPTTRTSTPARAARPANTRFGGEHMLVTVDSFREPWEAHLFKMRLEAEDIPAFVRLEYHIWMFWPYSTALGGARVQVPVHLQETACEIREL